LGSIRLSSLAEFLICLTARQSAGMTAMAPPAAKARYSQT